ncbi:MAG: hypothetical protein J7J29_09740 [Psychrobacter sp.]|jgi:hypothetical protein|uniref:hypothetical protein n=1 Tax=Psychrobacter namhaensis TaxID=292734 RepID=UPI003CFF50BD|nr:hypothetical protein [Psychrobacter sp.]|tara:strand:+ start:5252 stop:5566 length:315 start_codon:yes stop_codon:yes gene_type:complete
MATRNNTQKKWLTAGLVAAALTLSACDTNDDVPMETDTTVDAQTPVEGEATNTAIASGTDDVDVGIGSTNDGIAVEDNGDAAAVTANDEDVLDGTEDSEHISTY